MAIDSSAPEVLAELAPNFRDMLTTEPTYVTGRLVVRREGELYYLRGGRDEPKCGTLNYIIDCLNYDLVLHLVKSRLDLMWFHAGAAAYDDYTIMIAGKSGQGKSTLVTGLYARGWAYLSDDILPLDPAAGNVIPFPQTPWVRQNAGREVLPGSLQELKKAKVSVSPERVCREPRPIRAVILPSYGFSSSTDLSPCSPASAAVELLQNCLNFISHREAAVRYVCSLMERIPAFRLSFNNPDLAADLILQVRDRCQPV